MTIPCVGCVFRLPSSRRCRYGLDAVGRDISNTRFDYDRAYKLGVCLYRTEKQAEAEVARGQREAGA